MSEGLGVKFHSGIHLGEVSAFNVIDTNDIGSVVEVRERPPRLLANRIDTTTGDHLRQEIGKYLAIHVDHGKKVVETSASIKREYIYVHPSRLGFIGPPAVVSNAGMIWSAQLVQCKLQP